MRIWLVAASLASACATDPPDTGYTIAFAGDVKPDAELGTYKTGADRFTTVALSGGGDVAIDGIAAATPSLAVVDADGHVVQLATVDGAPALDGGLHAQAIARDTSGGIVVLWGIWGLPSTFVHYPAGSAAPDWSLDTLGYDTNLAVSTTGAFAYIDHDHDAAGFHERAHLVDADGVLRWTAELPSYAVCVWFAPADASARGEGAADDVIVFSYSFGEVRLAGGTGSITSSGPADGCPADAWYSRPITGTSLRIP